MTERKRAGARRSLAAAAGTKRESRRNDDTTGAVIEHAHHPDQIPLVENAGGSAPAPPPVTTSPQPARPKPSGSKYTAVLDDDTLDAFEHLTRIARRRLGRHVDKIEVLSAVLLLAADDVSLRDQVVSAIGDRTPRR